MMIKEAMQPVISKDDLDEHIEKTRAKFRRITQAYKNGYLSENERFNLFDTGILEGFFRYLESKSLKSLPYIKVNWHRFLEDYNLYKRDMEPNSPIEEPWLRYYVPNNYKLFYEADIADKVTFLYSWKSSIFRLSISNRCPSINGMRYSEILRRN